VTDGGSNSGHGVIVHADDFGETVEITRGICAAIDGGAVTSTSIMANMPGTADALTHVAARADRASFGVHLNLCEGRPLTQGRTLADPQGRLFAKRQLFARSMAGLLSVGELEKEIAAQIALVHDSGVRISHLDGHKHLHQLPAVSAAVARVLPRFGISRVRVTRVMRVRRNLQPGTVVRELLAWRARKVFATARLRSPRRIVDIRHIMQEEQLGRSCALLSDPGVLEIFCHPGTELADLHKPGSTRRGAELEYLLSPRFREILKGSGAQLITYWGV